MKKIFFLIILSFTNFSILYAQNEFIKFISDHEYKEKGIKCFLNEILPFDKILDSDSINIILGSDTIKDKKNSKRFIVLNAATNYNAIKNELIKKKDKEFVIINFSKLKSEKDIIDSKDTIWFVDEKQIRTPILYKVDSTKKITDIGRTFRLQIPNATTIFYNTNELKETVPLKDSALKRSNENQKPEDDNKLTLNYILGIFIILLILGLVIYLLFPDKFSIKQILSTLSFKGEKEPIDELHNKNVIIKHESTSLNSQEESQFSPEKKLNSEISRDTDSINYQSGAVSIKSENDILSYLEKMKSLIVNEIRSINQVHQSNELDSMRKDMEISRDRIQTLEQEINSLKQRVAFVDFLKDYCILVSDYFESCNEILNHAKMHYEQFLKLNLENESNSISQLLLKYIIKNDSILVGNWEQIINEIKNNGVTTNKKIIRSIEQLTNNEEKINEFKKLLFRDVLIKYSSNILILAEEYRNLSKFTKSHSEIIKAFENLFEKLLNDLMKKIKALGLHPKYVRLFDNYMNYPKAIKSSEQVPSIAYREIENSVRKDTIIEIISYGFESDFEFVGKVTLAILKS